MTDFDQVQITFDLPELTFDLPEINFDQVQIDFEEPKKGNLTPIIRCPACGKVYQTLAEAGARGLGLALIANCSECGKRWGVNALWRPSEKR